MKQWKKLSSRQLLKHPRLEVYEDRVEVSNGQQIDYVRFGNGHGAVSVLAFNEKHEVLLQKEYSYPPNEWIYQIPGGGIEDGEEPQTAALRELAEEAGYKGDIQEIGWFYPDNRRRADRMHVFVATNLKPAKASKDLEEEFESYWYSTKDITALIRKGEIHNYATLSAWAFYRALSV